MMEVKVPVFKPKRHFPLNQCVKALCSYKPLATQTTIRLLQVHPLPAHLADNPPDANSGIKIKCSIIETDLENTPVFTALSYTWGDPIFIRFQNEEVLSAHDWHCECYTIEIDGRDVSVAANLFSCLFDIRTMLSRQSSSDLKADIPDWSKILHSGIWIDALCINQDDLAEKSQQIPLMGRIYSQANYTIAYLGHQDKASAKAIPIVDRIGRAVSNILRGPDFALSKISRLCAGSPWRSARVFKRYRIPLIPKDAWHHVYAFCHRSWFRRAWVMQEVAMARRCIALCGGQVFEARSIMLFWYLLLRTTGLERIPTVDNEGKVQVLASFDPAQETTLCLPERWSRVRWNPTTWVVAFNLKDVQDFEHRPNHALSGILSIFRSTTASDPRDMLYAFLNLKEDSRSNSESPVEPCPDYSKPTVEVFMEWTRYILRLEQSLAFLGLVESMPGSCRLAGLPSWTPDFTDQGHCRPMVCNQPGVKSPPFDAGSTIGTFHLHFPTSDILELRGREIDSVAEVFPVTLFSKTHVLNVAELLLELPEYTWVRNPRLSWAMLRFLSSSHLGSVSNVEYLLSMDNIISEGFAGTFQSRFEVYWRTTSLDCYKTHHPAPEDCAMFHTDWTQMFLTISLYQSIMKREDRSLLAEFSRQLDIWVRLHKPGDLRSARDFDEEVLDYLATNMPQCEDESLRDTEKFKDPQTLEEVLDLLEQTLEPGSATVWLWEQMIEEGFFDRLSWMLGDDSDSDDSELSLDGHNNAESPIADPFQLNRFDKEQPAASESFITRSLLRRKAVSWRFLGDNASILLGRTLVRLESGLLGIAPLPTKLGDEVWAVAGSQVPFILRKSQSEHPLGVDRYQLIGEAYVHSIMHGEEIDGRHIKEAKIIQIV